MREDQADKIIFILERIAVALETKNHAVDNLESIEPVKQIKSISFNNEKDYQKNDYTKAKCECKNCKSRFVVSVGDMWLKCPYCGQNLSPI